MDNTSHDSLHDALDRVLKRAVTIIAGNDDAEPRPGQTKLAHDVLTAFVDKGRAGGEAGTGVGKALDLDTPIATPSGWTTMGQIEIGDVVFDETGAETTVTWISNVMTDRVCYEVAFSDGSTIIADADHQWATATRDLRLKQAKRRRMESDRGDNSIGRLRRNAELKELRLRVNTSDFMMTRREAIERFGRSQDLLLRARSGLGSRALNLGEEFDVRPALDKVIESSERNCGLLRDMPDEFEVMTTAQMLSTMRVGDALNHAVRVAGPLDTKIADLPIDPYLFGVWLGDGTSGAGDVTSGAKDFGELMKNVQGAGYHIDVAVCKNGSRRITFRQPRPDLCPYGHDDFVLMMGKHVNRTCMTCVKSRPLKGDRSRENRWNEPLRLHLRRLGVLGNKHIPSLYLRASIEQRIALLQGIMDTDGTASGRSCAIDLCNERLANDVHELITSLGIRSSLRTAPATLTENVDGVRSIRVVGTRWRMAFSTNDPMFRFERKLAMQMHGKPSPGTHTMFRYVEAIRPVATRPVRCIQVSSPNHLFLAGRTMIPTHNSLAYLVPAALLAAESLSHTDERTNGRSDGTARTLIVTESLALQSQLVDKDLPVVVDAVELVRGVRPTFALMKGWSNYVCAAQTYEHGSEFIGCTPGIVGDDPLMALEELKTAYLAWGQISGSDVYVAAINAYLFGETGDRADFSAPVSDEQWNDISITTDECPKADHCPFGAVCRPSLARELASGADIVVTNHALVAIQAANAAPVVIGNKVLGEFKHLVIDEAHGLANTVRAQGSTTVNVLRLFDVLRAIEQMLSGGPGRTRALRVSGIDVMKKLDKHLASGLKGRDSFTLTPDDEALGEALSADLLSWLEHARQLVPKAETSVSIKEIRARRRALTKIDNLRVAIGSMATDATNVARWIDIERFGAKTITGLEHITHASLRLSPVDVAPLLRGNVYNAVKDLAGEPVPMAVVAVSATLPQACVVDLGISARVKKYASPFEVAFAHSALFVPKLNDRDLDVVAPKGPNGRRKFDTGRHVDWAAAMIVDLVGANAGSALVLAATTTAGKRYVDELRRRCPELEILSQWDAGSTRQIVDKWRDDIGSVLVGTRSLMTGVDAPGATASLIIVDRPPRSAGNPVDDARVARIQERLELDRWAADRLVYVADSALLLKQAAGRLIRSVSDSGMVCVLDPRLLKSSHIAYNEPTRQVYMAALNLFAKKISDIDKAKTWLVEHRHVADEVMAASLAVAP
jgi:ATP-dependent DNA helicase DinG